MASNHKTWPKHSKQATSATTWSLHFNDAHKKNNNIPPATVANTAYDFVLVRFISWAKQEVSCDKGVLM